MKKLLEFLKGKKTYITAIAIAILGVLQGLGVFAVPEWIWLLLNGLGLATMRDAVNKVATSVKQ